MDNRSQSSEIETASPPAQDLPRGITTPADVLAARVHDLANDHAPLQRGRPPGSADEREQLRAYLADFARELHDAAPLSSTISRVLNLFREAGLARERWGDILYQARAITQEHSAQITTPAGEGSSRGTKNKMPYYLAVVESLMGFRDSPDMGSEHQSRPRHDDGENAAKPSFTKFPNRVRRSG